MSDLFQHATVQNDAYSAKDIEVLEGLEPVRRRPGMYIGGTDASALHHLVKEVLDNAMDEVVAGHATRIEVSLKEDQSISITDNGRGIPVDPHPKYPNTSALEVILTTLHAGGKFSTKAYQTAGGLHGVGLSVVNALSDTLSVEVIRNRTLWQQTYHQGIPATPLQEGGKILNRRGTKITFHPDTEIFGPQLRFSPEKIYKLIRSKAYLFPNVEILWTCAETLLSEKPETPANDRLHFPGGLQDFLAYTLSECAQVIETPFSGKAEFREIPGRIEWALAWPYGREGSSATYCNTIPTPLGGTHESGFRQAITRSFKAYCERMKQKKGTQLTAEDVLGDATLILSIFIQDPQFQGQTKEKLVSRKVTRAVEGLIKDHFDHWLSTHQAEAEKLLGHILERLDTRLARRLEKETARKSATRRLNLPGKLVDCSRKTADDTELFLVEGDSAGGPTKQARDRKFQAVLPLRGKILNVAQASADKLRGNQEIADMIQALGCGVRDACDPSKLRYSRVIIMTDADVDGAHIAALLLTFFFQEMKNLLKDGRIYLAQPPLYRLTKGNKSAYARDDAHKDQLLKTLFKNDSKVEISRFKGLGEMPWPKLKETTMDQKKRVLLRVLLPEPGTLAYEMFATGSLEAFVDYLMGRRPEKRFEFIQSYAHFVEDLDT